MCKILHSNASPMYVGGATFNKTVQVNLTIYFVLIINKQEPLNCRTTQGQDIVQILDPGNEWYKSVISPEK